MNFKVIDVFLGEKEYFEKIYFRIYGRNTEVLGEKSIKDNKSKYKYLIITFGIIIILYLINNVISSDKNLIKNGEYIEAITRPQSGSYHINLIAEIEGTDYRFNEEIPVEIRSSFINQNEKEKESNFSSSESIKNQKVTILLNSIKSILDSNTKVLTLPKMMEDGSTLKWQIKKSNDSIYILLLFVVSLSIIYFDRYSKVHKNLSAAKNSVLIELPEFIDQLVLLLDAGLVLPSAFIRIVSKSTGKEENNYFNEQMIGIKDKVELTNSSLIRELKYFAERIQVREFIRTVNIISDNIYMGAMLVDKLKIESDLLWENRKKYAEEQNRINETKLTFPLAIHLIILITITISPALISK